jgi:PleD family two-component response regulator
MHTSLIDDFISRADQALYNTKKIGKNKALEFLEQRVI